MTRGPVMLAVALPSVCGGAASPAPWVVSLTFEPNGPRECVGTLLNPTVVVTSAACVHLGVQFARVSMTEQVQSPMVDLVKVARSTARPDSTEWDLGLVWLEHPSTAPSVATSWSDDGTYGEFSAWTSSANDATAVNLTTMAVDYVACWHPWQTPAEIPMLCVPAPWLNGTLNQHGQGWRKLVGFRLA